MIFPWFSAPWSEIVGLRERMPHALLIHGQAGIGKLEFATEVARSLLCETLASGSPRPSRADGEQPQVSCGTCEACIWFDHGNHPDFRMVRPDALDTAADEALDERSSEAESSSADGASRAARAPSKEIRIDQIRALQAFLGVGTHRGGHRVVLLYPLQALNVMAANALLKMLEEPPPQTVFLLVADGLGGIAPTILSRCRKLPLRAPSADTAAAWLTMQGIENAERLLAEQGGAPLAARAASQDADASRTREAFVTQLAGLTSENALANALTIAETFGRDSLEAMLGWMQQWIADCASYRLAGRIRYHPTRSGEIAAVSQRAQPEALLRFSRKLDDARRHIDHPLNARLVLESLLLAYADVVAQPAALSNPPTLR